MNSTDARQDFEELFKRANEAYLSSYGVLLSANRSPELEQLRVINATLAKAIVRARGQLGWEVSA